MPKLKLSIENLQVEPFPVEPALDDDAIVASVGSYTEPYRYCLNQPDTASCNC